MALNRDDQLVFPVPLANGSTDYVLGPGFWQIFVYFRGTGVDVQLFPLGITGVAMGTAYSGALVSTVIAGTDPVATAVSMTTGRCMRWVSPFGSGTNALNFASECVPVIQKVRLILTNISAATEITLVAVRRK